MSDVIWPGETRIMVPPGGGLTRLGDYAVPPVVNVFHDGEKSSRPGDSWPDVHLKFEVRGGVVDCTELRVNSAADDRAVRISDLAIAFNLEHIATDIFLRLAMKVGAAGGGRNSTSERMPSRRADLGERAGTRLRELESVARIFLAPASRRKPTQSVADSFGYTVRTAARRVDEARLANLIPPARASDAELDDYLERLDERIDELTIEQIASSDLDNLLKGEAWMRRQKKKEN